MFCSQVFWFVVMSFVVHFRLCKQRGIFLSAVPPPAGNSQQWQRDVISRAVRSHSRAQQPRHLANQRPRNRRLGLEVCHWSDA